MVPSAPTPPGTAPWCWRSLAERLDTGDSLPPMKDLARLAGVGVGTVYRHFPTQRALLAELGAAGTRRLIAEVRAASENDDPAAGLAH